jgi:DnaJ like chaperone protein
MSYWGKLIGGFCGLLLAGPFGLLLGIIIGHIFDRGLTRGGWHVGAGNQAQSQQAFFNATFLAMGYIAKADGRVSEAEIQAARSAMDRMGLGEAQRQKAMDLFTQGKQSDFNLDQTLTDLLQACHRNKTLLRMFVELQVQAARADGVVSPQKQQVLQQICQRLGFAPLSFVSFEDLFGAFARGYQQAHQQQGYGGYRQYSQQTAPPRYQTSLKDAYTLLNITEAATDADVKRAYRRMMSQHHPDKLVSKGLPEEMIKLATEKTQNIKAAYEQICAARGI